MQQHSALWRELSACVVRPAAVMAMLLLVLHAPHSALSQWPICYDHFVPDRIGPTKKPGPQGLQQRCHLLPPPDQGVSLKLCAPRVSVHSRVSSSAGCPMRNKVTGQVLEKTDESFTPCYHTNPWDVTSPSSECRTDGCRNGRQGSEVSRQMTHSGTLCS